MHEPTYRQALSSGWRLVRHHPVLWILGILAVLSGQFGLGNFMGQLLSIHYPGEGITAWSFVDSVGSYWTTGLGLVWLALIVGALMVAVVLVSVVAQGALATAAGEWYHSKESPDVGWAWHRSVKHFWRLLSVALLRKGLLGFILIVIAYWSDTLLRTWDSGGAIATIFLLTLGMFLGLVVASVAIYTTAYILIEERSLGVAVVRGWHLFRHHMLVSLETSSLLLLILFLVITGVILVAPFTLVPVFIGLLLTALTGTSIFISLGVLVSLCLFTVLVVLVGGYYNAFATSVWMYLFMKMHHEGIPSRVFHWLGGLVRR